MARQKEFNQDIVLGKAIECFWQRGFSATSMKHLEVATALTPGSIYNSFGSKDGLFLACLDHYNETVIGARVKQYLLPAEAQYLNDPLAGIEAFIETAFDPGPAELCLGCLMVNSSVELGPHEESVRLRSKTAMKKVVKGMQHALGQAQAIGQLGNDIDCRQRAQSLLLLFNGMLVQWRGSPDKKWLEHAMHSVKDLLH